MNFFDIQYAYFLLILPVLAGIAVYAFYRKKYMESRIGDISILAKMITGRNYLIIIKQALLILAILFFILGLMRPKWGVKLTEENELGIDIAIAIDISNSMNVDDIQPSRLKRVLSELEILVSMLEGNRIGLVLFAGGAFIQSPLTSDINAIRLFLSSISTDMINLQGTDIKAALKKSYELLKSKFKRNKLILLLSDGEQHEGDPASVAEKLYKKDTIHIFTIGVGTKQGSLVPKEWGYSQMDDDKSYKTNEHGNFVRSKLDEKTLIKIASLTGGRYFRIGQGSFDIAGLVKYINNIEKDITGKRKHEAMIERFQLFIAMGLLLLFFSLLLPERERKNA